MVGNEFAPVVTVKLLLQTDLSLQVTAAAWVD